MWPRRTTTLIGERGLQRLLRGQFFYCPAVSYRLALVPRPAWDPRWRQVMDLMLYGRVLLAGGSIELLPVVEPVVPVPVTGGLKGAIFVVGACV